MKSDRKVRLPEQEANEQRHDYETSYCDLANKLSMLKGKAPLGFMHKLPSRNRTYIRNS